MDKYKRLFSNTLLFGFAAFSGKLLSFLMVRFHTSMLSVGEFGTTDVIQSGLLTIAPLVHLGIVEAITRFTVDTEMNKAHVFSTSISIVSCGFVLFGLCYPIVSRIPYFEGYVWIVYLFTITSIVRLLFSCFVRGLMHTKLYAMDNILLAAYTIGFNILYLGVLKMGVAGFFLAIISADALSAIGLFFSAALWRYLKFFDMGIDLFKKMLRYSLPLVPGAMSFWINTASDKFFIAGYHGVTAVGIYAAACKVTVIITVLVSTFSESWQLSAVLDAKDGEKDRFFSRVFGVLRTLTFLAASGLILFGGVILRFLATDPAYLDAVHYLPILILGAVFTCFSSFLNSIFLLEKKTTVTLVTVIVGAVANVLINILLTKQYGLYGASIATLSSNAIICILRFIGSRKLVRLDVKPIQFTLNILAIGAQVVLSSLQVPYLALWSVGIFVLLLVLNLNTIQDLWNLFGRRILSKIFPSRNKG